jgi:DNA-binding response OmpR family regulator
MRPAGLVALVVDDDPAICDMVKRILKSECKVESAPDAITGLARIAAGGIDLVVLDRRLPDMDGLELCRRVRERQGEVYLPIILLTGLGGETERHAGFAVGADDYVTKPFKTHDLRDRVRVWLRTRQYLKAAQQHEHRVQDEVVLTMALTTSHDLTRLLMLLLNLLEQAHTYSPEDMARLRAELHGATIALAARINTLTSGLRTPAAAPAAQSRSANGKRKASQSGEPALGARSAPSAPGGSEPGRGP